MDSLAVFFTTLVLYLVSLTNLHSGDSLLYALQVESGSLQYMLDPFHFIIHPLGWGFWRIWQLLGWQGGSLLPMQVLNALGGAICVTLFFRFSRRLTGNWRIGSLVSLGFAISGGVWFLSTDAEFVTLPLAVNLFVLGEILTASDTKLAQPAAALWLGVGTGFAVLFYLSALMLVPVVFVRYWLISEVPGRLRLRWLLLYSALVAATGALIWLLIFLPLRRLGGNEVDLQLFSTLSFYGTFTLRDLLHGGYAFLRSLALYPGLGANSSTAQFLDSAATWERALWVGYYLAVFCGAILPILLAFPQRKVFFRTYRVVFLVLMSWAGLHTFFAILWVPGDFSFWLPTLTAWWIVAGLVLSRLIEAQPGTRLGIWARRLVFPLLVIFILGICNASFIIMPARNLANNPDHALLVYMDKIALPGDGLVAPLDQVTGLYLRYFSQHPVYLLPDDISGKSSMIDDTFSQWVQTILERDGSVYLIGLNPMQHPLLRGLTEDVTLVDLNLPVEEVGQQVWKAAP